MSYDIQSLNKTLSLLAWPKKCIFKWKNKNGWFSSCPRFLLFVSFDSSSQSDECVCHHVKKHQLYIENFKTEISQLKISAQSSQSLAFMGATVIVKGPTSYKSSTKPCCIYLAITDISSGFHNTNTKAMELLSFWKIIWAAKTTFLKIF